MYLCIKQLLNDDAWLLYEQVYYYKLSSRSFVFCQMQVHNPNNVLHIIRLNTRHFICPY